MACSIVKLFRFYIRSAFGYDREAARSSERLVNIYIFNLQNLLIIQLVHHDTLTTLTTFNTVNDVNYTRSTVLMQLAFYCMIHTGPCRQEVWYVMARCQVYVCDDSCNWILPGDARRPSVQPAKGRFQSAAVMLRL